MKQLITIFCLFMVTLLVQSDVLAQPTEALTIRQNWYNYTTPQPAFEDWTDVFSDLNGRGLELAYSRNLSNRTWLVIPAKFGVGYQPQSDRNLFLGNLDLLFENRFFKHGSLINPTIQLGVGTTWDFDQEAFDLNVPVGAGLNIMLLPNVYLNLQSQFRFSIENRAGWHHGGGLVFMFNELDRDKDGIKDTDDKCPDVPGVAALMGCPDRDGDGITDTADNCPDVPGIAELNGCPDKDGDMITDAEDDCPEVKGLTAFKGCPDTDNDGITDASDKCPTEPGPASTNGCPDKDGDSIIDSEDKCPTEKGPKSTMGCPDRDSDGVADKDDACPDKKGDSMHKGCPDTDGDSVYDNEDRCPEVPGVASLYGCPEEKPPFTSRTVLFDSESSKISKEGAVILDEVAAAMAKYTKYSVTIGGHADNTGSASYNQKLSERRAKSCADYLAGKGIDATRIMQAGFGESKPATDNKKSAGRKQNRRAEFELKI